MQLKSIWKVKPRSGQFEIQNDLDRLEPFIDENEHREINAEDPKDLEYWAWEFRIGIGELKDAIVLNGTSVKAIKAFLSV